MINLLKRIDRNGNFLNLRTYRTESNQMKTKLFTCAFLLLASICHTQKRIDYIKQTNCEKIENNKPNGSIYSRTYTEDLGDVYQFKMDGFVDSKLRNSDFDWNDQNQSKGISYSINHEENEESFGMNWFFVDSLTGVIYSFSFDVFNKEIEEDSRVSIERETESSQFEREFQVNLALVKQAEEFVDAHLKNTTPFTFKFPMFDLSILDQPIYAWHSESKTFEKNIAIQYETDSTLEKGIYQIENDSSFVWDEIIDNQLMHHFQHGTQLQIWEGEFHMKSKYTRIILTPDFKDTTYKIEYSRNKNNEKPYHNIEVTHYLTEHTDSIDIEKRYIHIKYDKSLTPIYREMKAVTFDGQEVYSVWGKKLKEEENINQLYVTDAKGESHFVQIYSSNIQMATYLIPFSTKKYRPTKINSRKRDRRSLKRVKQEFELVEKSKYHKTFVSDQSGSFLITEVFYK
ncbi:MAG: hypothetical protein ACI857_001705 [Arenicella sp.]|jgi:hypothetical protein